MKLQKHDGGLWVKASEELPDDKIDIFFKVDGLMDMGFFDTKRREFYSSRHRHAGYIEQSFLRIEWLKPFTSSFVLTEQEMDETKKEAHSEGYWRHQSENDNDFED